MGVGYWAVDRGLVVAALIFRQAGSYFVALRGLMIPASVITCPHCGASKAETMPTDACQFFYDCTGCGARLKPKAGDCCVFCSYASVPCPPIQEARAAGKPATCCGG